MSIHIKVEVFFQKISKFELCVDRMNRLSRWWGSDEIGKAKKKCEYKMTYKYVEYVTVLCFIVVHYFLPL